MILTPVINYEYVPISNRISLSVKKKNLEWNQNNPIQTRNKRLKVSHDCLIQGVHKLSLQFSKFVKILFLRYFHLICFIVKENA